jgi:DNA-nicking Smr family endonuclease
VSDDDADLFRRSMVDAKPLQAEKRVPEPRNRPVPKARFSRADEEKALEESLDVNVDMMEAANAESMRYHRPHVGKRTMRRLSRGKYAVQAEIDLHGMTVAEARPRLADFVDYSLKQGLTCVRIVHGKGLGSGDRGPVLKMAVNRWLRKWDSVLAFVSARQVDGGTGAIYVLLDKGDL